jgi:hypothetical protein
MLPARCFEEAWLKAKKQELGVQDLELLERTVHAFALLHGLLDEGLDFVFKGGTCMLLLPTGFQRLSLDVDIQTTASKADLERILAQVVAQPPFTRWRQQERAHTDLPQRSHYEFFYTSRTVRGESKILLDVVEDVCPLTDLNRLPAAPTFMALETAPNVTLPTLDALLGDKLTAFAPGTIGVPLSRNLQVIKQLHDIRQLARHAAQPEVFRRAYQQVCAAQNRYRRREWSLKEVAADTVLHAWHGRIVTFKDEIRTPLSVSLTAGKNSLGNYLLGARSYNDAEYQIALATAAALAVWASDAREEGKPLPILLPAEEFKRLEQMELEGPNSKIFKKLFGSANVLWAWTMERIEKPPNITEDPIR